MRLLQTVSHIYLFGAGAYVVTENSTGKIDDRIFKGKCQIIKCCIKLGSQITKFRPLVKNYEIIGWYQRKGRQR